MSEELLSYWQRRLAVPQESLRLPTDYSRIDSTQLTEQASLPVLPEALYQELIKLVETGGLPPPIFYLAAFYTLLFHYSGQRELCVGVPTKALSDDAQKCNSALSVIPMVIKVDPSLTFTKFAYGVYEHARDDLARVDGVSLGQIAGRVEEIQGSPVELFRAMYSFAPMSSSADSALNSVLHNEDPEVSGVECQLVLSGSFTDLIGHVRYRTDLFERETVERFANHYVRLLESVVAQPDVCIGELEFLSDSERTRLVEGVNQTQMDYPRGKTVSQLFSEQVLLSGDSVAVRGPDDRTLSYEQLEQESNRLAGYLVSRGVGPGGRVGVYLERSVEMLSTLLAVIKSGAAYVPLDPLFPADRLSYMAEDAQLALIVTQRSLVDQVPIQGCEQVVLELLGE